MNGGKMKTEEKILLGAAVVLFAFLILCPLTAVFIVFTATSSDSPEEIHFSDIYGENNLQWPFWPLERNNFADLSEEQAEYVTDYMFENIRNTTGTAGRMNFGACKAFFLDCGDYVHEIVFYYENTTEYDLTPELMAENSTVLPGGGDLTAGYRMYRVYPEFPAYRNAEIPYIDFTDAWTDSSVSCIAGEIASVRTEGRFYRNYDGKVAAVIDMTDIGKKSGWVVSGKEMMESKQDSDYSGTVSFEGEYVIPSVPVMPVIYIDSHVTCGPYGEVGMFSFSNVSLPFSFGIIGLLVYLLLLILSGGYVIKYLTGNKRKRMKKKENRDYQDFAFISLAIFLFTLSHAGVVRKLSSIYDIIFSNIFIGTANVSSSAGTQGLAGGIKHAQDGPRVFALLLEPRVVDYRAASRPERADHAAERIAPVEVCKREQAA